MTDTQPGGDSDEWSRWLLHVRHGGDSSFDTTIRGTLENFADRVLDGARLAPGMTLADIGTGTGLVAFRAIERIGPSLRVVLTDISAPLLRHVEGLACERGVREQCTFIECGADKLGAIADASVDVVATRAVLAYVADKSGALREFLRILKPGGRISLAEPIFQDDALAACALRNMIAAPPQQAAPTDRFRPLLHRWKAAQFPDTPEKLAASPLANYSERTLFELTRVAGFAPIHLELHIDLGLAPISSWKIFLETSPHPWAPPLTDILAQQFTPSERQYFEETMRPLVESGRSLTTIRTAYITAAKP
jgi:ubiquinone/menaquinone biosynthesis C-methylase UbiE